MNNKNSHSDKNWELTPEMIQQYHEGTLSAEKMHWVERQLLDDEFAAEAFEGVANVENLPNILAELEQKIDKRIAQDETKVIPFRFKAWQIAASLSLLLVASYFIFNSLNPSKQTLALEEKTAPAPTESMQKNQSSPADNAEIVDGKTFEETETLERKERAKTKEVISNLSTTSSAKPIIEPVEIVSIEMDDMITEDAEMEEVMLEQETTDVVYKEEDNKQLLEALSGKAAGVEVSKEKAKSTRVKKRAQADKAEDNVGASYNIKDRTVTGRITSNDGDALPGVNVIIKGSTKGTATDIDGFFTIDNITENDLLVLSFIGLTTKEVEIGNSEMLNIVLENDHNALSEVVVTAQGVSREERSLAYSVATVDMEDKENTYQSASPMGGKSAFKKYLEENIQYPKVALDRKIEGKVKVIFYVEPNGSLTNFEVKKGLGHGCDEEAIRLIKEGPKWSAAERDSGAFRQKASVTIRFKLEE